MQPFFSTIIPTHNRAELLGGAIDSALAQEFDDNEIIVVDDGSTDATADVLARYQDRIRVLRQDQQGPGAARNLGIEHARGQYIAFLDSDDLWFPWTLATYERVIREYDSPSFLTGRGIRFVSAPAAIERTMLACDYYLDYLSTSRQFVPIGIGAVTVRADALREVGGFPRAWINAEDSDLWIRLGTFPGFLRIREPALFAHRCHAVSALADFQRTIEGKRYIIQQEKTNCYPGGAARWRERIELVTRHARSTSIDCVRSGRVRDGWTLYLSCLLWNLRLWRGRYVCGFPLLALLSRFPTVRETLDPSSDRLDHGVQAFETPV
jgi:GT2 family glycosyltransferase